MAYTPTEWECGDIVTVEKLNAMERGVADMNAEYVPTEWACGDIITAEKLNHIEQGIANGCGGSSDFSTATVTVTDGVGRNILLPFIVDDDGQELHSILNLGISESGDYIVPLYKSSLTGRVSEGSGSVSVSGNITYLPNGMVVITGDCTITIS